MSADQPNEASIFNAARQIESTAKRDAFLAEACGDDAELRERVEKLLSAFSEESQFLEQPPAEFEATVLTGPEGGDRGAALEAGLAATFGDEEAVVVGNAGHSVLRVLGQTVDMPRVVLRESQAEADDPIARPKSPEMPKSDADSRYQLQGEIARGGMGAIIKGRDTDLGRDLAIKVLLDSHKDRPEVIQRFVEEAQIGGQLQHPGIAPIYELGQFTDRRPFFAMKLVKGQTLSKLLADREDAAEDRGRFIGIFKQVCETMGYAHSRGVIHRDLKPANIMVGAFGEVQVMDWGLAKVLSTGGVADEKKAQDKQQGQSIIQTLRSGVGSDPPGTFGSVGSQTQMGSVMGTPAYMPPEQALGEIDNLDERADVFGLGAILCEILTGQPPYVADNGTRVYRMASRGKLDDCFQRLDDCGADEELIALTKHCLELDPVDRPRDAGVLAERVTAYMESVEQKLRETELAKVDAQVRAEELRRRQRLAFTAGTAIVATLLIGLSVSLWQMDRAINAETLARSEADRATAAEAAATHEAKRATAAEKETAATLKLVATERDEKERARMDADKARDEAEVRAYTSLVAAAAAQLQRNDSRTSKRLLEQAPERLRGWEWEYLWNESDRRLATTLTLPPASEGYWMDLSRDGRLVATRPGGSNDRPVTVYDTRTGNEVAVLNTGPSNMAKMTFSSDNKLLAYQYWGTPGVQVFEIATGRTLVPNPGDLRLFLGFGPGQAVVLDEPGKVRVFKTSDWSQVTELPGTVDPVLFWGLHAGAVSPDGKLLAINRAVRGQVQDVPEQSGSETSTSAKNQSGMQIYDLTTNALVQEVPVNATAVKFSNSGRASAHFGQGRQAGWLALFCGACYKLVSGASA